MRTRHAEEIAVRPGQGYWVIDAPAGRGEELAIHLGSHGIRARLGPAADQVEVEEAIDPDALQAIIDEWER